MNYQELKTQIAHIIELRDPNLMDLEWAKVKRNDELFDIKYLYLCFDNSWQVSFYINVQNREVELSIDNEDSLFLLDEQKILVISNVYRYSNAICNIFKRFLDAET